MADHFVIDGSNLATEGRTEPSFAQLREAVAAFGSEHPDAMVTVVVDASFEHRIDPSERAAFEKAEIASEVVSPPAGAVGRGDGFLLKIANRTDATVVSNDSFQEFHAEYEWLFEPGRLIGGKPVPGVGWIFSLRRPVRGIVSRKTTQRAKKEARAAAQVQQAIAEATADAITPGKSRRRRRGRGGRSGDDDRGQDPEAVNEPAPFLQFVIDHRLGTQVDGEVDSFSSHGAFVVVDGVRCYLPLSAMGDPRPTRARDVLTRGERRAFVVQAVDAPRRGIELALPGFEKIAGSPSDETLEAELHTRRAKAAPAKRSEKPAKRSGKPEAEAATKKGKKKGKKKDAEQEAEAATKQAGAKPAKAATKQAPARKTAATEPAATTKAAAKRAPAKPAAKRAPTKQAGTTKATASGKEAKPAAKKPATARKAAATTKKAAKQPATKATPTAKQAAKKPVAKKPAAKQPATKQSAAKKATAKATPAEPAAKRSTRKRTSK